VITSVGNTCRCHGDGDGSYIGLPPSLGRVAKHFIGISQATSIAPTYTVSSSGRMDPSRCNSALHKREPRAEVRYSKKSGRWKVRSITTTSQRGVFLCPLITIEECYSWPLDDQLLSSLIFEASSSHNRWSGRRLAGLTWCVS